MNLKHNILALVGKANKALLTIHPSCCTGVCRFNLVEFGYLLISLSTGKLPNPYEAELGKKKALQKEHERAAC